MKEYLTLIDKEGTNGKKYEVNDLFVHIIPNKEITPFYDVVVNATVSADSKIIKDKRVYTNSILNVIMVRMRVLANIFGTRIDLYIPHTVVSAVQIYDGKNTCYEITASARIPKGGFIP
jgi:outer membrane phospholipase A